MAAGDGYFVLFCLFLVIGTCLAQKDELGVEESLSKQEELKFKDRGEQFDKDFAVLNQDNSKSVGNNGTFPSHNYNNIQKLPFCMICLTVGQKFYRKCRPIKKLNFNLLLKFVFEYFPLTRRKNISFLVWIFLNFGPLCM